MNLNSSLIILHSIISTLKFIMRKFTILLTILFAQMLFVQNVFAQTSPLTLSEIMFNPSENNGEFIEIYNTSTTETVNLAGYKIKYYTSTADNLVAFIGGMDLAPGKFAVILENDYDYNNGVYKNLIPADAIVLKISDASFGTSGMANTTSRDVSLLNPSNVVIDTYIYSADNNAGISDEKFLLTKNNDASNWRNSTRLNGTPGAINSVTPINYLYNLTIKLNSITPVNPVERDTVKISFVIKNNGEFDASNFSVDIFKDANGDSIKQAGEILFTKDFFDLSTNDSIIVESKFYADKIGQQLVIGKVNYSLDEKTSDNTSYVQVNVSEKPASYADIVINELMYLPANDEPEWIELFNRSDRIINLKNWKISDQTSTTTISTSDYYIAPGEYLVISSDATISNFYPQSLKLIVKQLPSLNNTGDQISIRNSNNLTIDSVKYLPEWGGNSGGKSLERISTEAPSNLASNWATSESKYKATPSKINSVTQKKFDLRVGSVTSQSKYVEIGKSIQIKVVVENKGLNSASNYSIKLFKDRNLNNFEDDDEKISELTATNLNSLQTKEFTFTVSDFEVGTNQFIARVDFVNDEFTENNSSLFKINAVIINENFGDLVINEIMYAPNSGEPEWIEIYNNSTKQINLNGYQISNSSSKNKVVNKNIFLNPEEYLVVTKDSSMFTKYPRPQKFVTSIFSSLNNSGDDVVIKDSLDRTIDSLKYKSSWGGLNGKSLERFDFNKSTNDSTNWKTANNVLGGTPGFVNSISKKKFDVAVNNLTFNPSKPLAGEKVNLSCNVENIGKNEATFKIILNKINKDNSRQKLEESNTLTLSANGNLKYDFNFSIDKILSKNSFEVVIGYNEDEDLSNNSITSFIRPGYLQGTVLLNEIMYAPLNGEPEWIELYNNSNFDVDLEEWTISDELPSPTKTFIQAKDFVFPSKSYLVIAKDSTIKDFHKSINSKIIYQSFAALNNDADGIVIRDSRNIAIDSLRYDKTFGGENGKSIERILFETQTNLKSNWGSSKDIELSTPGKINSLSPKDYDLELSQITSPQKYAVVGKRIKLNFSIKNIGKNIASEFTVKIYLDSDKDGLEKPSELIYQKVEKNLAASSSLNYEIEDASFVVGKNSYIAVVEYSLDQSEENNRSTFNINAVIINEERNDLVINEIMYAPTSAEPEWIEIYNNSSKQINLKGYQIANSSSKAKVVIQDFVLKPEEYFVVARDSSFFNKYSNVKNISVSNFPILNNTKDRVVILDSLDRTIDSLFYKNTWGGSNGKSLERIDVAKSSVDSTNWKTSTNQLGATPGFINSISQKKFDLAISKINFTPAQPKVGENVRISVDISNIGKSDAIFNLVLNKINKDGSKQKLEESNNLALSKDSKFSYQFSYIINSINAKQTIEVVANFLSDQDLTNNSLTSSVLPGYSQGIVLINEVMFNPTNGEPEWIELYNNSNSEVDLEDWSITDVLTTPQKQLIKAKDTSFPPKTFLVVSKDSTIKNYHREINSKIIISTFANLNNDEDGVVIKDSRGTTIDSLRYSSKWGGENGKSLERKLLTIATNEKTNWGSSKDLELSTPGRINSIAIKKYDLSIKQIVSSPNYPVLNQDVSVGAKVINYGTDASTNFVVKYFKKENNQFIQFDERNGNNLAGGDSSIVFSNNKIKIDQAKTILCKVFFNADEDTLNNSFSSEIIPGASQNSILITEIMYDPLAKEPEWIEFYNASNEIVNLKNWMISDLLPSPTKGIIPTKDSYLKPGEFAIATTDTNSYAFIPPKNFYQVKFGTLGNTSDGVLIYDFRGAVIDSLFYKSSWGGGKGNSLERISFTKSTNDSTNWSTSISNVGASPGISNSTSSSKKYSAGSLIINEIMYEPETGKPEFVEFYNNSKDTIQIGGMDLRIGDKDKIKLSASSFVIPQKEFFVLGSDSSIFLNYPSLKSYSFVKVDKSLSLSNSGTKLFVKDLNNTTLDSLSYLPTWHNRNFVVPKGKSLERINPSINSNDKSNWSSCVANEGATPGKSNSIFTENLEAKSKVAINPNPFSPDGDGFEDFTIINFDLPYKISQVNIKVFDNQGRLVRSILSNRPSSSNNSIIFDGLDDNGKALRMGIYILLIEVAAEGSNNIETIKTPIVIARKL